MYKKSLLLLFFPLGILFAGTAMLQLRYFPIIEATMSSTVGWVAAVAVAAIAVQIFLLRRRPVLEPWLFPMVMLMASIGVIMIGRLKPVLFVPQLRWLLIGMLVMVLVTAFFHKIREMLKYQYIIGICCLMVLCLALVFGTEIGGSRNWIILGPIQVQPSEFGKTLIVLFLSSYLADHKNVLMLPSRRFLFLRLPPLRFIAPLLCIWGMAVLMFVVQRDLGSALLFFGIAIFMTYMGTGNKSYVFLALSFFALSAVISYLLFGHVRVRFDIWLHPWNDPNGQAYQVVQSLFAFGSGGIWGTGFLHGHPGLIPEVHTDFIFSAIAEEFGLLGSIGMILVYLLFFYRGLRIALACREDREVLLAAGLALVFILQTFIILAGVTKLLPLTGITLPFVSYGGSSMVSGFLMLGLLISLSEKEKSNE